MKTRSESKNNDTITKNNGVPKTSRSIIGDGNVMLSVGTKTRTTKKNKNERQDKPQRIEKKTSRKTYGSNNHRIGSLEELDALMSRASSDSFQVSGYEVKNGTITNLKNNTVVARYKSNGRCPNSDRGKIIYYDGTEIFDTRTGKLLNNKFKPE